MRVVCISDTHCHNYDGIELPAGDLLIHAGDHTYRGDSRELSMALNFLSNVSKKYKYGAVIIAGNHDCLFEKDPILAQCLVPSNVKYLEDDFVIIEGIKIYGTPWQPEYQNWAFNEPSIDRRTKIFSKIPSDTDLLISHCPPYGVLDEWDGISVGCEALLARVLDVEPKWHVFGHIHDSYGFYAPEGKLKGTQFANVSLVNDDYKLVNNPIVINL